MHLGGERREDAIRRAWAPKFAAVANEGRRLAVARQRAALDVERARVAAPIGPKNVTIRCFQ
jgi:hypothetical protein